MISKEYKKSSGVYKVKTFRTTQTVRMFDRLI